MTIYEKLKDMSPEQLIAFFVNEGGCPPLKERPQNCYQQDCVCCWLRYLFHEVIDNDKNKNQK